MEQTVVPVVPVVPRSLALAEALERSEPLANLRQRLRDSNARYDAVRPHLPARMADHVTAGPVDAAGWTLLAANASVAAKLRHLEPLLQQALRSGGWDACTIRIKVADVR